MQFNVQYKTRNYQAYVPGFGEHQVYNALSAIAAVYEIGINISEAIERLKSFQKYNKQLQIVTG